MQLQIYSPQLRHLTSAHLAQTMSLLELSSSDLRQKIEAELAKNPALELVTAKRCPSCRRLLAKSGVCGFCQHLANSPDNQPIIFVSPSSDFTPSRISSEYDDFKEELTASVEDLPAYVLSQIAPELQPDDRLIAAHILTSLDDDGLLRITLAEIARYQHVSITRVDKVVQLIQRADPIGVGCSCPTQALLVQLEVLSETQAIPPLTKRIIEEGLDLLGHRAYHDLARRLGATACEVQQTARFITANLNPFPGRSHWGDVHKTQPVVQTYLEPDIIITRLCDTDDTTLSVEIISPYAGLLRVNPLFKEALNQAPTEKLEKWQSDLDHASLLVKCLQQRDHSLVRLLSRLVVLQREYILNGDAYLQPVTRAQLADELEVHESTISRAVSNKAVQLPNNRIVPLSKFFDRSLHIRTALREIIAQETTPLSDIEIACQLSAQGFEVARRTVAKYRAIEGILPARYRNSAPTLLSATVITT